MHMKIPERITLTHIIHAHNSCAFQTVVHPKKKASNSVETVQIDKKNLSEIAFIFIF